MNNCPVCFEKNWLTQTPCNHLICLDCLLKIRQDSCPTCRKKLLLFLPKSLQLIVTMAKSNSIPLNIHDYDEFPILQ